jgi:hypothetical protein
VSEPIEIKVKFHPLAKVVGYVLEEDATWFRLPKGTTLHLLRSTGPLKSWCGVAFSPDAKSLSRHVTWPWGIGCCWGCMDRRWAGGIR